MIRIALHTAFSKGYNGRGDPRGGRALAGGGRRPTASWWWTRRGRWASCSCTRSRPRSACPPRPARPGDLARDPGAALGGPGPDAAVPRRDGAPAGAGGRAGGPRPSRSRRRTGAPSPACPWAASCSIVSRSPTVLPFASVFMRSLRGDEILVEPRLFSATKEWRRLVKAADMVFADGLSADAVAPRRGAQAARVPGGDRRRGGPPEEGADRGGPAPRAGPRSAPLTRLTRDNLSSRAVIARGGRLRAGSPLP